MEICILRIVGTGCSGNSKKDRLIEVSHKLESLTTGKSILIRVKKQYIMQWGKIYSHTYDVFHMSEI
jgi:hypothetical protein